MEVRFCSCPYHDLARARQERARRSAHPSHPARRLRRPHWLGTPEWGWTLDASLAKTAYLSGEQSGLTAAPVPR